MFASYLITDPHFYSQDPHCLRKILTKVLANHTPTFVCLRDKSTPNYASLALATVSLVQKRGIKVLLHQDFKLAAVLGADGVHLPSDAKHCTQEAKHLGLHVIVSTHTLEEALYAQAQGADAITFSPIFASPGKGAPVGLEKLKEIVGILSLDVFALGGIVTNEHVRLCAQTGASGFASIRYFCDTLCNPQ